MAKKGFSIEGGMIFDFPSHSAHNSHYSHIKYGPGLISNFGYNLFDWGGVEVGVMYTSHGYELGVQNGVVLERTANKTTFFLKARGVPFKREKIELVATAGIGFFDISGARLIQDVEFEEDFSGLGFTGNLEFRYNFSTGLGAGFVVGTNIVNYSRYELLGLRTNFGGKLPGGDSIYWGITLYHHIGIPQI